MVKRLLWDEEGVLTFEWVLLVTVLVIGVVGALSGVRDAVSNELAGVAGGMVSLDQSYGISRPLNVAVSAGDTVTCAAGGVRSSYRDAAGFGISRGDGTVHQPMDSTMLTCNTFP